MILALLAIAGSILFVGAVLTGVILAVIGQLSVLTKQIATSAAVIAHAVQQHALLLNGRLTIASLAQAQALEKFAESQRMVVITVDGIAVATLAHPGDLKATKH